MKASHLLERLHRDFPHLDSIPRDCLITGGPVRDVLLERPPADLDLASPDAERAALSFEKATSGRRVTLGARFQTERVIVDGAIYDFSSIQGSGVEEDLGRRDFTINAIGLTLEGVLIDPFDGRADIEAKIVRMVHEDNLVDDPLRILRAPRMTGALGFNLDSATAAACRGKTDRLARVAPERITTELRLVLESPFARRAAEDFGKLGLDEALLGFHLNSDDIDSWDRLIRIGDEDGVTVLALLLIGTSHRTAESVLERWSWNRSEVRATRASLDVLRAAGKSGDQVLIAAADQGRGATERATRIARAREMNEVASRLEMILSSDPSPFDIEPILDGHEIAHLTGATGKTIGELKRALWEGQVLGRVRTREEAVELVKRRAGESR